MAKRKITSHYWRVRVVDTNEEKDFETHFECRAWMQKVINTFGDYSMNFEVIEIIERSKIERIIE